MKIGSKTFDTKDRTYIMGILNVTPDSFSDGGKWNSAEKAISHVQEMIEEGADLIDIGGESTRPGHTKISDEEEIKRVVPIIQAIKERFPIPVSIDTYKAPVAEAAILAGADMVNDIWGLTYDKNMAQVIAKHQVACCLMHNRKTTEYQNFMDDLCNDLAKSIELAKSAGIADENIMIDPGIGFGKTYEQNLEAINRLEVLNQFGYPVLLATSRKSVIGLTLDLPAEERVEGTVATSVIGVMKKCSFVRVHDIKENKRAVQMTEAIIKGK